MRCADCHRAARQGQAQRCRNRDHETTYRPAPAALLARDGPRALTARPPRQYDVTIRTTECGIPHIGPRTGPRWATATATRRKRDDLHAGRHLHDGAGRALAATSARPRATSSAATASSVNNLNSDFFFQQIIDDKRVEKLLAAKGPGVAEGGDPAGRDRLRRRLQPLAARRRWRQGRDRPRPARARPWVKPITEIDAYRRFYQLALLASGGVAIDGIGGAQPPTARRRRFPRSTRPRSPRACKNEFKGLAIGSNAVALGSASTTNKPRAAARQPALPVDRLGAVLPVAPDDPRQGRRRRRLAARRPDHPDRPHRAPGLVAHGQHGVPVHAVPGDAGPRPADDLPLRRRADRDDLAHDEDQVARGRQAGRPHPHPLRPPATARCSPRCSASRCRGCRRPRS